jgi:DNA-binding CsgD family transcriptional regulator
VVLITSRPVGDRSHAAAPPDAEVIDARFQDRGLLQKLTPRETEVLMLIGEGLSTADISKRLFRTIKTIEAHRASLGRKLGVSNRVQLARIALAAGLVQSAQRGGRAGESGEVPAEPVDADRSNGHATHVHAERVVRNNSQMA